MTLDTVTVSIAVSMVTGAPLPNGRVRFTRTALDVVDSTVIVPDSYTAALDAEGTGNAALVPNGGGSQGTGYSVEIFDQYGNLHYSGSATVPDADCALHDVLALGAPPAADALQQHLADPTAAHAASSISVEPPEGFTSENLQHLAGEVAGKLAELEAPAGPLVDSDFTIGTGKVAGRASAGDGPIEALSVSQLLDLIGVASQGSVLVRGATGWQLLSPGTDGQFLRTRGAAANPDWAAVSATPGGPSGSLQGNVAGAFGAVPNWSFDPTTGATSYAGGTAANNAPPLTLAQTWNDATKTYEGLKVTITDTNAAAASRFVDIAPASGNPFFRIDRQGSGGQATARHVLGAGNLHSQAFIFDARSAGANERLYTASGTLALGLNTTDVLFLAGTTLKQIGSNATSASTRNLLVQAGDSLGGNVGPGGTLTSQAGVGFGSGQVGGDNNVNAGAGGTNGNGGNVNVNGGAGNGTGANGDVYVGTARGLLRVVRGLLLAVSKKTANYTVTSADPAVRGDASGGDFTVTLEACAVSKAGRLLPLKNCAGTGTITLAPSGSDTVDGASSRTLTARQGLLLMMNSDGNGYDILAAI